MPGQSTTLLQNLSRSQSTTTTEIFFACRRTLSETLPHKNLLIPDRPLVPMTKVSYLPRAASFKMSLAIPALFFRSLMETFLEGKPAFTRVFFASSINPSTFKIHSVNVESWFGRLPLYIVYIRVNENGGAISNPAAYRTVEYKSPFNKERS